MRIQQLLDLTGRVAIVTGGYAGLGRQMAEAFLEAHADVAVCARRVERWSDSFKQLREAADREGRRILGAKCDVSVEQEVQGFLSEVERTLGPVDILVNNAGITWRAPPEEMRLEDWRRVIDTNLTGAFICSQIVGRTMIRRRHGSIVNVSSIFGIRGAAPETLDTIGYNASKAAIIGLTRDLAAKWARYSIRVNALAPGWFETHLTHAVIEKERETILKHIPLGRLGGEDDLKGLVVFLASEASQYITGQTIVVDGGLSVQT